MVEVPGLGMRRGVPSPKPLRSGELDIIRGLYEGDPCVVAVGGGGIPVIDRPDGDNEGVEAGIGKDPSAAVLASAIAAYLARGRSPREAVAGAKRYVTQTLRHAFPVGGGHGPLNHLYRLWRELERGK